MKGKIFYNETIVLFIYICYVLFKNRKYSSILNVSFLNKILHFIARLDNKTRHKMLILCERMHRNYNWIKLN